MRHRLYKTGDKDAPSVIKDRNGEVVLGLCRDCGAAECELEERSCTGSRRRFFIEYIVPLLLAAAALVPCIFIFDQIARTGNLPSPRQAIALVIWVGIIHYIFHRQAYHARD